jgi:hypothetical protein
MIAVLSVSTRVPRPAVRHRRDRALRIDREVAGLVLVELEHVDVMAVERHALFHQRQHRLARIGVGFPVVERDPAHAVPPAEEAAPRRLAAPSTLSRSGHPDFVSVTY